MTDHGLDDVRQLQSQEQENQPLVFHYTIGKHIALVIIFLKGKPMQYETPTKPSTPEAQTAQALVPFQSSKVLCRWGVERRDVGQLRSAIRAFSPRVDHLVQVSASTQMLLRAPQVMTGASA